MELRHRGNGYEALSIAPPHAEGTTLRFLLAGVPQLIAPWHVETYMAARRIEALGCGLALTGSQTPQSVAERVSALCARGEYRSCAVPLANGNVLLCGQVITRTGIRGLITLLDGNGRLVQEKQLTAQNNPEFFSSSLRQCFTWNGGVVAIGDALRNGVTTTPSGWFLQLDANGALVSEHVDPELFASSAFVSADGTLVLADFNSGFTELRRVDGRLHIVGRRAIASSGFGLLRPASRTAGVKLIAYQVAFKATLYSLGQQLEDVQPPHALEPVYVDKGRGYVLEDDSLALLATSTNGSPTPRLSHISVLPQKPIRSTPSLRSSRPLRSAMLCR